VVEHVNIALLCFEADGKIILLNRAAQELLQKPFLKTLNDLKTIDYELYATIVQLAANEKSMIKVIVKGQLLNLLVQVTEFKMQGLPYKLVSLQDFRSELEAQEIESWQKLIRVLTHEIMNSVIPIANLSGIVNQMLEDTTGKGNYRNLGTLDTEEVDDLHGSLQTIENRSKGLVNFVKAYKSLTQMGEPTFKTLSVHALFEQVYKLLQPRLTDNGIVLEKQIVPAALTLKGDVELLEQVLINLLINAMEALEGVENPVVKLVGRQTEGNIEIQVADNGPGIPAEILEHIFVPFYTTKKTGSGVGLSLARQIMRLHKGSIAVQSAAGEGTRVVLSF
jgi:two-component system, NtrC family, nitrogen regulation sensor histidine kinase NtrY